MNLIKNPQLLKEDYRSDDFFNNTRQVDKVRDRLNSIADKSIYALVGPYGVGKSTLLYQIEKSSKKTAWIHFDAWKYPERHNLWEGFVLDVADTLGQLNQTIRFIDGTGRKTKTADIADKFVTVASMIPALGGAEKLKTLFEKSPATRVFQLQNVLSEFFESFADENIVIVVEDIDRSGDRGIYFLETLNYFLKNSESNKRIIAVAPISDDSFYSEDQSSYMKSVDYFDFFEKPDYLANNFVDELFTDEALSRYDHCKSQVSTFLKGMFQFSPNMDLRRLKVILRDFVVTQERLESTDNEPDWRVTLAITASKYLTENNEIVSADKTSLYQKLKLGEVNGRSSFIIKYLFSLSVGYEKFYTIDHQNSVQYAGNSPSILFTVERKDVSQIKHYPSKPWVPDRFTSRNNEHRVGICDFYLR